MQYQYRENIPAVIKGQKHGTCLHISPAYVAFHHNYYVINEFRIPMTILKGLLLSINSLTTRNCLSIIMYLYRLVVLYLSGRVSVSAEI